MDEAMLEKYLERIAAGVEAQAKATEQLTKAVGGLPGPIAKITETLAKLVDAVDQPVKVAEVKCGGEYFPTR